MPPPLVRLVYATADVCTTASVSHGVYGLPHIPPIGARRRAEPFRVAQVTRRATRRNATQAVSERRSTLRRPARPVQECDWFSRWVLKRVASDVRAGGGSAGSSGLCRLEAVADAVQTRLSGRENTISLGEDLLALAGHVEELSHMFREAVIRLLSTLSSPGGGTARAGVLLTQGLANMEAYRRALLSVISLSPLLSVTSPLLSLISPLLSVISPLLSVISPLQAAATSSPYGGGGGDGGCVEGAALDQSGSHCWTGWTHRPTLAWLLDGVWLRDPQPVLKTRYESVEEYSATLSHLMTVLAFYWGAGAVWPKCHHQQAGAENKRCGEPLLAPARGYILPFILPPLL
eukprot:1175990-Prorocentrum_minimum.AAC.2